MTKTKFATVGDVTLHYRPEGIAQGLPLVFLNSLGTDLRIWDAVTPHFAGRFLLIRHDKRGHGLSDCPPGPYTLRDYTTDLAGLLDQLGVDEAILIGDSVGGMIALDYALTYPDQIKGLVLCDTAAKIGSPEMWNERIDTLRQNGMEYLAETILARWFSPGFKENNPAAYRGYRNMLVRTPLEGYIATCEAIREADLREGVTTLQTPALVLCGAEDASTPPDLGRGLAEALPKARFELIAGAGHIPSLEQPAALAEAMDRFLRENGYG
jgi:3-oxoadipate enol-lactonase